MSEEKTSEMWIGTDLGTSNSVVSVYQQSTQTLLIPTFNGSVLLPSLVHFAADGSVMVGEGARIAGLKSPERTIFAAKRMLGRKFSDPVIQEGIKTWPFKVVEGSDGFPLIELMINGELCYKSAIDVQTEILKEIRFNLAQQVLHWDSCENIVITVPAYFNHNQRHCTIQSAYNAGFKQVAVINEPSAAAFYFGYKESALADRLVNNILVFDLGGGTLDVSLIDVKDKVYRVLSTDGDTQFGGFDIDKFIVDWLINQIKTKYHFDIYSPSLPSSHLAYNLSKLSTIAEKLKKALSQLPTVIESSISLRGVPEDNQGYEDGFEITIDRTVINKYFTGNKQGRAATLRAIQRCVKKANLTLKDIHKVILVGGSTRIPAIPKMITQFFQNDGIIAKTVNADEAVTLGACLHAATLSKASLQQLKKPIELYDIAPLAYNIRINDNNNNNNTFTTIPFIPRNSCLIRDSDITIEKNITVTPSYGKVNLDLIECDDIVDLSLMTDDSGSNSNSNYPKSPGQAVTHPDSTDDVLLSVQAQFEGNDNNTEEELTITLRLTSDYKLSISVIHDKTQCGIRDQQITPFMRNIQFTVPGVKSNSNIQENNNTPQQPSNTDTNNNNNNNNNITQQQISSISTPSGDLILGKRPEYWKKELWVEKNDPMSGIYYENKVTGDKTLYDDDFDYNYQLAMSE